MFNLTDWYTYLKFESYHSGTYLDSTKFWYVYFASKLMRLTLIQQNIINIHFNKLHLKLYVFVYSKSYELDDVCICLFEIVFVRLFEIVIVYLNLYVSFIRSCIYLFIWNYMLVLQRIKASLLGLAHLVEPSCRLQTCLAFFSLVFLMLQYLTQQSSEQAPGVVASCIPTGQ